MAKNNVGKKPISQEEYTTNKVLAVFSVCLLGVLVLMILERLLGYSNTWKTGVLVTRVLLGVGIVGAAASIIRTERQIHQTLRSMRYPGTAA